MSNLYDSAKYSEYYESLSADYHVSHDHDQARYEHVLKLLEKVPIRRVLDIGCGTGTFLGTLPADVERFGIEPSRAGADRARARDITMINSEDLSRKDLRNTFDLVTAIDVIEHARDLAQLRDQLLLALRPGGTLVLLTGNSESRPAQMLGRYWYYVNFAEHVSIFSANSIRTWLQRDFAEIEVIETGHHRISFREKVNLMRMWLLFPAKYALRVLFPGYLKMNVVLALGKDHMLVRAKRI